MEAHSGILTWRIPMDRGAWQATVHRVTKKLDMTEQLNTYQLWKNVWGKQSSARKMCLTSPKYK